MRAATVGADGWFQVEDVPDPTPEAGDLVLRVTGCGVCGSDLKMRSLLPAGSVMGHELCGEVVALGSAVGAQWREGMHAPVFPVIACGACEFCRADDIAHCTSAALVGLGGAPGGFAEYIRIPAVHAFALPASVPVEWGPLVEPFAVGLHAVNLAAIAPDDDVLVIGAGPVGLTVARWARELGAATVTVSDPVPRRRDAAGAFAATTVVDPKTESLGGPYDVVIECVGKPGMLDTCAQVAGVHGRIVVAGVCAEPDPFLPIVPLMKELSVRFAVFYRPDEYRVVIDAFASGRIDPSSLITRTAGLGDLTEVFTALATDPNDLKVVVSPT